MKKTVFPQRKFCISWLNKVISAETASNEIQRANELLEKLSEYKPLAKIEEMEEQNFNMVDNVLNNGTFHLGNILLSVRGKSLHSS